MSPRCVARIQIRELSSAKAAAIRDALAPDNVEFPAGQSISMSVSSGVLEITVDGGTIGQFVATVDEVLEHVQVALGATSQ